MVVTYLFGVNSKWRQRVYHQEGGATGIGMDQIRSVPLPQRMQDAALVQVPEGGHVFHTVELWRVGLLYIVLVDVQDLPGLLEADCQLSGFGATIPSRRGKAPSVHQPDLLRVQPLLLRRHLLLRLRLQRIGRY